MIKWNVNPEIFSIGPFHIRWYGLLFATAFIIGYEIIRRIYQAEDKKEKDLNDLLWYMILGTIIGARLGHCLFYNPKFYLSHPIEILLIWKGGLASHGAGIGILLAIWLFSKRKPDQSFLWVMDRIVITVALAGAFIRTGNLFNSEIIGKPTNLPWSFVFERVDDIPRHPTQIYEALAYLIIFFILFWLYKKYGAKLNDGYLFGLFLILVFTFRFFVEFLKAPQEPWEQALPLDMGQLLSIPFVLAGLILLYKIKFKPIPDEEQSKNKHRA
jgi:phosphatidylglycerol:prolipoprotein diacylglycerol transferase